MKKQLIITLTVLILTITMAGAVSATVDPSVKYVSPTGNDDNDGTETNPYLTIGKGITSVSADGTVNVADGTYYEHLTIDKNLNLVGQSQENTILDGSHTGQPITINTGATVNISLFTIQNGYLFYGGGIYNTGTLTVSDSTISGNNAIYGGGGIYNTGTLTVSDLTISGNNAEYGGGIWNYGTLTVSGSTISGNNAYYGGGGIYNTGTLTVSGSTISGNNASSHGGGIWNNAILTVSGSTISGNTANFAGGGIATSGTVMVFDSTISGNSAVDYGGGIWNYGNLTVSGSTISGNNAYYGGGGIYNYGTLTVSDLTISGNNAEYGGGIFNYYGTGTVSDSTICDNTVTNAHGGGIYNHDGNLEVSGSTISGNSAQYYGGGIYNHGTFMMLNSTISGNTASVDGGGIYSWLGTVTANFNRIVNNSPKAIVNYLGSFDAKYNWWGSNNPDFSTLISGVVDYSPWLYMTFQANPTSIAQGETSTLTANFNNAFDGTTVTPLNPVNGHLPDGILVTFKTDLGQVGSQVVDKLTISGVATATLNGTESGTATVNAALDTEELTDTVQIGAEPPETGIFTRLMVQDAAIRVRNFITSRGVLPNWVRMEDTAGVTHYVTMPVFLELSTASLISTTQEFKAMDVKTAPKPVGSTIVNRNLQRSGYMDMASRVNNFIRNNGVAPNFAWSSLGNIRFQSLVDSFARIVAFKAERGVLPNYVVINTRRVR